MAKSAIVESGTVINVIVGNIPGSIDCADDVDIGWGYDGSTFSAPPPAPVVVSAEDVQRERGRRLALGFAYDFADERGVHHIGTTPADMIGWRDVIDYAGALVDGGDTATLINIVTDTGPAAVTALEWQAVTRQAASVRQVLWAASFVLQSMTPIPLDYATNEDYWV